MTTSKPSSKPGELPDLNSLAIEACDMWQEHLSSLANDPAARADLTRFLEPQRRLFADWATLMQQGMKGGGQNDSSTSAAKNESAQTNPATEQPNGSAVDTPSRGAASDNDPLRAAQLALRVAELEKRVAGLEARLARETKRTQRAAS